MRVCSFCKQTGHNAKTCQKKKDDDKIREKREMDKHVLIDCPIEKIRVGPKINVVEEDILKIIKADINKQEPIEIELEPKAGLWIVNPEKKKIAGLIIQMKKDGTILYETSLKALVETRPLTCKDNGYRFVILQPYMLTWSHS